MTSRPERWSELHSDIDPAQVPLLLPWLRAMWWLARPLRRVPPVVVTVVGVFSAIDAVLLARRHPVAALVAVLIAALCDALDGAIAVVAGTATRTGAVADAVADRIADVAFALVLWRCGAPLGVAVACAVVAVGVDGLRRVRHVPDRITVGERPTWTICAVLACASVAVTDASWPVLACAAVWLALGVASMIMVLFARGVDRGAP